jgi:hypothetical protein
LVALLFAKSAFAQNAQPHGAAKPPAHCRAEAAAPGLSVGTRGAAAYREPRRQSNHVQKLWTVIGPLPIAVQRFNANHSRAEKPLA